MSSCIIDLIGEIKAGRPVGIVKSVAAIRQEDKGSSAEKITELPPIDTDMIVTPPLPIAAGSSQGSKIDTADFMYRLENRHIEEVKKRMVPNPAVPLERKANKSTKRKADDDLEASELRAENVAALNQTGPSVATVNDNGARRKPRTKKVRTKKD